ncbi:DUF3987 domain-containing protein [Candidatus Aalborgicola defluviihabitans]|uniref:DUF3987 domain-containing protein n=1 Tax=Candidatus Aalborgicola defluviihabitans TaxID=3386187 RepID=UPI001E0B365D|nr:DUF3987 domain-containing protein [Burkholderiales bacterium]MBK7313096.1 DUF3987 domain-containing protein [Burkholderiales bacterium]
MSDIINQFRDAIAAAGLTPPDEIIDDGKIHRFSSNGKPRDESGWYVLHSDGVAAGAFGDWREGFTQNWCSKSNTEMTQVDRESHQNRVQAMKAQRDSEQAQRNESAALEASRRVNAATVCTQHPYLDAKGVKPYGVKVEMDGTLLVPMRDDGKLWNVERINLTDFKDKRGLSGGRRTGCYHAIGGKPKNRLIVGSGYATCASIHEATGDAVAVAFNDGNLGAVAGTMRFKFPDLQIIVAADDDYQNAVNGGVEHARAAALAIGGYLAVPDFGANRPEKATDFNDLHQIAGLDAVKRGIDAAIPLIAVDYTNTRAKGKSETWPVPAPLPDALPPVMAFNYSLLPDSMRPWVADMAERMQCPPDFLAAGVMVAISGLVGARVVIQPKARDNWLVTPNLWGAIIGRPGAMKSPALNEVLKPLKRIEAKKREAYQAQCGEWEVSQRLRKLQDAASETRAKATLKKSNDVEAARELLRAADLEPEPIPERLIVNDTTIEALGEIMRVNPWGLLVERDEIYGLLKSMDREGKEGDRAFYLTAYDGDKSYTVDRIMRGLNLHIPRLCAAMIGGIQPGRLSEYVRGAMAGGGADDGLIQRFQMAVWPDSSPEWQDVDEWPDTPARQAANAVFDRLEALPTPEGDAPVWRFDDAAQALFREWRTELELRLRSDTLHPVMEAHLSKNRKTIPALALLFALIDTPEAGQVCEPELIRALGWAEYLETHATRIYAAGIKPEIEGAALLLKRIRAGAMVDKDGVIAKTFTTRDVYRKGWQGLGDVDAVRGAADMLVEYDWLRRELVPGSAAGGRPSEQYRINPAVLGGGKA